MRKWVEELYFLVAVGGVGSLYHKAYLRAARNARRYKPVVAGRGSAAVGREDNEVLVAVVGLQKVATDATPVNSLPANTSNALGSYLPGR